MNSATFARKIGCSNEEAMTMLMLLYDKRLLDCDLLIYHASSMSHKTLPFSKRAMVEGFPELPVRCAICGSYLTDDNVSYEFDFHAVTKIATLP